MSTRHSSLRDGGDYSADGGTAGGGSTRRGGGGGGHHHTQFLDLTNGKGGDQREDYYVDSPEGQAALMTTGDGGSVSTSGSPVVTFDATPSSTGTRVRSVTVDPNTPGRVVDPGQEHTGRWTKEEHEAFLSALQMYGKEWKKVAAKVRTRTVVQTRTHAQKYFQKLHKTVESTGDEDITQVDMGITSETKRASTTKRKQRTKAAPSDSSPSSAPKLNRRSSNTTINAAQVISNLSGGGGKPTISGRFIVAGSSATMSSSPTAGSPSSTAPLRHGFSTETPPSFPSWVKQHPGLPTSVMKIAAPDPSSSMRKGFPEPSPAATGKRKLAEIAAARMLAGVGSKNAKASEEGPPTPPPEASLNLKEAPEPPLTSSAFKQGPVSLQIVNPAMLGVTHEERRSEDSPVTPWEGQLQALVDDTVAKKGDINFMGEFTTILPAMEIPLMTGIAHPVCGPGAAYGRSPLHTAVCDMDLARLEELLQDVANQSEGVLQRPDEAGYRPLHSACALSLSNPDKAAVAADIVGRLIQAGADVSRADNKGNTPLHWAARAGDRDVVSRLLFKNAALDVKNQSGETPLHWAMRAGYRGIPVVAVLLESGARPSVADSNFRRPLDVAGEGFKDDENSLTSIRSKDAKISGKKTMSKELKKALKATSLERKEARANLLIRSPHSRTLVLHHPECLEHHPKSTSDWEAPERIKSILRRVVPSNDSTGATETSGIFPHEVTVSRDFDRANLDLLSRVHSTEYLSFVNTLSKDLEKQLKRSGNSSADDSDSGLETRPPVVPFTPLVQRTMIKIDESNIKLSDNSDTSFSAGSLKAARRAAGAVQHAVDCVLVGRNRNAFCVVRPPGHHAGINGLLEGGESCGFCIFNNVAAGALYAISDDRLLCERCAIVDIDVHHGNGTEEIVRNCNDPSKLFFFSIHLYDNDRRKGGRNQFPYKFYPGTGAEDDLALNIINVPIVPLWKETPQAVAPAKTHNTRRKAREAVSQDSQDDSSETGKGSDGGASETGSTTNSISTSRSQIAGTAVQSGRLAYRQAIQSRLLPALRAFNPDLILISAGFDAAKNDVGNARHERGGEKMGIDLEPEDYAWTTRKVLEVADICCHGRVVSVLEGGYGRSPPVPMSASGAETTTAHDLDRTVFAECAVRHLHAMIDPYDSEQRFSQ